MSVLIAFDLDDTLYKEQDYVRSGLRAVAREAAGISGLPVEELAAMMLAAPNGHDAFEALESRLKGHSGEELFPIWRMVATYRNHKPELQPDPAVNEILSRLKQRGYTLSLITDGNPVRQHAKISALGLARFFDRDNIIVSADTGADKTTPLPFVQAENLAPGSRRIYVGDNPAKDFHWPNLRGWHSVMLRDGLGLNIYPQRPDLVAPQYRAATTIGSLSQLLDLNL